MLKYHLSPKTGNPGICKAKYKCAFGDIETEHYSSRELARAAYEEKMRGEATSFSNTPKRVKIQSAEKFEEVLQDYELKSPKLKPLTPFNSGPLISSKALRSSLIEANNSGDRYFRERSINIDTHPGGLSITAEDAETGEEIYFYVNTISGFAFYGDDPQGDARDDLTFQTVFGKVENPQSVEEITECMLDLYEERESRNDKWDSDLESIKFSYVNYGHFEVNAALRTGKIHSQKYRDSIDAISRENTLEDSVTVYRGVPRAAAKPYLDSLKRGEGISDNALLSTSVDPRVAKKFASQDGYVFAIQLPKGQQCLDLSEEGNEGEILLPRQTKLENIQIFDTKVSENA